MYWHYLVGLIFLFCSSQVFSTEEAEQDLLKAAIQETEVEESAITEKESRRELAEKSRRKIKGAKSAKSPSKQEYDFGDVVITVSDERELEEAPEVYLQKTDGAAVLNVKKTLHRKTSSVKSGESLRREPSSSSSIKIQKSPQREPSSTPSSKQ